MIHIASGYFVYFHDGHKKYLDTIQKRVGPDDIFIVIVNNEKQQEMKYGKVIRPPKDICTEIKKYLYRTNYVVISESEDRTVSADLEDLPNSIFYNDGGEYNKNLPEKDVCVRNNIKMVFLNNPKIASASKILGLNKRGV